MDTRNYLDTSLLNKSIDALLANLDVSTCNFTAVSNIRRMLDARGFRELRENEEWEVRPGDKCYLVKNESAIFAFVAGMGSIDRAGLRIVAAHTDSPCFKIKPNCEIISKEGLVSLNVEKYGGGILYTWFDRPLAISGRVMAAGDDPLHPVSYIIDSKAPIATIPHLAIHFNRAVNEGNPLSVQKDMKPVIGYVSEEDRKRYEAEGGVVKALAAEIVRNTYDVADTFSGRDILDYELALYPLEPAARVGLNGEFFQSARIDDLSMAYAGLEALLCTCDTPVAATRILALFDNEETGSGTKQGAASPVLRKIVERLCMLLSDNQQAFYMTLGNSFMISADDAHGWHPNYNEKYDPTNHPMLGGGPVVKINANCKYMTDATGAAVFKSLCQQAGEPMQYFVNHADVAGGSTLGNISSAQLDIPGVDVGNAIWAMHSARETAACSDHLAMVRVFEEFWK